MITINAKTKKWGHSIGVIIPKKITRKQHIKPEQTIVIHIEDQKSLKVRDIFGINKRKIDTAKALKEIDNKFGD
jgi:antitoxin component of MazEF toxin-antitoxin module